MYSLVKKIVDKTGLRVRCPVAIVFYLSLHYVHNNHCHLAAEPRSAQRCPNHDHDAYMSICGPSLYANQARTSLRLDHETQLDRAARVIRMACGAVHNNMQVTSRHLIIMQQIYN